MKRIGTKLKTQTDVSLGQKVVVSLMMASAFMLTFTFAAAMIKPPANESKAVVKIRKPRSGPQPLIVSRITNASTNLGTPTTSVGTMVMFLRGAYPSGELGSLDLGTNLYHPAGSVRNSSLPLQLVFSTLDPVTVPNSVITIENSYASTTHALCVPAINLGPAEEKSYFYNNNGTPYLDSLLRQVVGCWAGRGGREQIAPE